MSDALRRVEAGAICKRKRLVQLAELTLVDNDFCRLHETVAGTAIPKEHSSQMITEHFADDAAGPAEEFACWHRRCMRLFMDEERLKGHCDNE